MSKHELGADLPLFDAARRSDPLTSRIAARDITEGGARAQMTQKALHLVRMNPGSTANELEWTICVSDGRIRKRLNDLLKDGLVRRGEPKRCSVTGRLGVTWHPL